MNDKVTGLLKPSDGEDGAVPAAGAAVKFDAASQVAELEAKVAKLEGDAAELEGNAAHLRTEAQRFRLDMDVLKVKMFGPADAAPPAKARLAYLGDKWFTTAVGAALLLIAVPGIVNAGNAVDMLRWWALSAAVLALVGAFLRLIAHGGSKEVDKGGKMFGLAAATLTVFAAGALLVANFGG